MWPFSRKSYTAGHFQLAIDEHPSTAYLKSIDGGWVRTAVVDEPIGPHNMRIMHTSVADIEPMSFEIGMAGANSVLKWIQDSWRKNPSRRNGQVTHGDFNLETTYTHEFTRALITETTFPALDGLSKDPAYIKVKFQPEGVKTGPEHHGKMYSTTGPKQKLWLCSGFTLRIDNVPGFEWTNHIDSFTIKQNIKKLYTGRDRFPRIEPTRIEFPRISGTVSLPYADKILEWYDQYVVKGQRDRSAQRSGAIEFLSPINRSEVIFRINLFEVGIHHASIQASTANAEQIKRVKFELYVGRMDLDSQTGFDY